MTARRSKGTGSIYKRPDSAVFWLKYSKNGKPYRERACVGAGVGQFICADCASPVQTGEPCESCKGKRSKYTGLIFHDLRRTAARNLRRAGIPETVIMKIGGWRTRSVFERYAIVSRGDIQEAMQKLQTNQQEIHQQEQISHDLGHAAAQAANNATPNRVN